MEFHSMIREFSIFWFLSGFFMLVPHFVFTLFLKKRKYFILRSIIGLLLYAVAAYLTCFTDQWHERYYLLLHLAAALYLAFCCRCSIKMIVYFNIWCIVLYYFIFQILSMINAVANLYGDPAMMSLVRGLHFMVLALLSVLVIKTLLVKDIYNLPVNQVIIAALISASIIAFNTISFAFSPGEGNAKFMVQVFSMLCNLLAMYLQVIAYYSQKKNFESEYIKHMWKVSKKDHELKAEYIDLINHKYHDLKHEIRALRQLDPRDRNAQLDKLEENVDRFGNLFQTDNELVDSILNDFRRHCEKKKIAFSCIANCGNISFMDIADLSILLGNMLDNAMEATVQLPEENRVVDLKLQTDDHFFRITEKNTYTGELNITSDGLATSKPDTGYHGFGSQSMKYIVEKYSGQMALDAQDGIFSLHVIIPVPKETAA